MIMKDVPNTELVNAFFDYVATDIDEKGIFPSPCLWRERGGKLNLGALALDPKATTEFFIDKIALEGVEEIMFGLDRSTKPDQGTEFADVLTCAHWRDLSSKGEGQGAWSKWLRVGVINYQHEPRIVRPIDWNNGFWIAQVASEIQSRFPATKMEATRRA
jgi:hypothetical protein